MKKRIKSIFLTTSLVAPLSSFAIVSCNNKNDTYKEKWIKYVENNINNLSNNLKILDNNKLIQLQTNLKNLKNKNISKSDFDVELTKIKHSISEAQQMINNALINGKIVNYNNIQLISDYVELPINMKDKNIVLPKEKINYIKTNILDNVNFPNLVFKDSSLSLNSYYLDLEYVEKASFIIDDLLLVEFISTDLNKKINPDIGINDQNKNYQTSRTNKYKLYIKNQNNLFDWVEDFEYSKQIDNIQIQLSKPSDLEYIYNDYTDNEIIIDWDNIASGSWFEGEIQYWKDGDTPVIKILSLPNNNNGDIGNVEDLVTIRVQGIDTPEKAVGGNPASPLEYSFAEMSTKFGTTNLPGKDKENHSNNNQPGTRVRVFYNGKDTYGRVTGDIFFGNQFNHSYSVAIVRMGLTLPYADTIDLSSISNDQLLQHYTYYLMGKAMKHAQDKKLGFFKNFNTPRGVSTVIYKKKPHNRYMIFTENNTPNVFQFKGVSAQK
ncbi:hypothetical protein [Mycoplasmopsis lipofaciens]|uniref:hypothetical protein n=1 Tax=Mycoplasmopsis lipofaciens TaxID=114884 RepID=UPI00068B0819|nr:hypothetical protein [Mycoplasmopsis lipofaciens]